MKTYGVVKIFSKYIFSHKIKSMVCLPCDFKFMLKSPLKIHIKIKHNLELVIWDILNTLYVPYICFNDISKSLVTWGLTVKSAITKQSPILILIVMSVSLIRPIVSHHLLSMSLTDSTLHTVFVNKSFFTRNTGTSYCWVFLSICYSKWFLWVIFLVQTV